MWEKRIFKWANSHQRTVVAGMFLVMAIGIAWLLAKPEIDAAAFQESGKMPSEIFRAERAPITADMVQAWQLYSALQNINPDSLSASDSTFLHDIDKQLNTIIYE